MTMTAVGSPLWAGPEVLAGKRYSSSADVYSFGVVIYEILMRHLPYRKEREDFIRRGGKGMNMQLGRAMANGDTRIEISKDKAREHDISPKALSLFKLCCQYEPESRPSMPTAVQMLEDVLERMKRKNKSDGAGSAGEALGSDTPFVLAAQNTRLSLASEGGIDDSLALVQQDLRNMESSGAQAAPPAFGAGSFAQELDTMEFAMH